jgi:hypothetical protein
VAVLRGHLAEYRYTFNDEMEFQSQLETVLNEKGYRFKREEPLSAADRPDFLVECIGSLPVALEVKVTYSLAQHMRQMHRYCAHGDKIAAVVLVCIRTGKLPETLNKLPVFSIQLWRNRM